MKRAVIIVAAGKGERMGREMPKQFLMLGDKPMIFHCMDAFIDYDDRIRMVIGLSAAHRGTWERLSRKYAVRTRCIISEGGKTRFHTVKNALGFIDDDSVVAVHDAVRPFVSKPLIHDCFQTANDRGTAVPCVEIPDSIRKIQGLKSIPLERSSLRMVQTPQTFRSSILLSSYEVDFHPGFTDDASVVEYSGHTIHLTEGNRENIKITTRADYLMARRIIIGSRIEGQQ